MKGVGRRQPQVEQKPWMVTIAASAGGITALKTVLGALPKDLPAAIVIVQHRSPTSKADHLSRVLQRASTLPVVMARDGQRIEPGTVYLARSDLHLTITARNRFCYTDGTRIRFLRSSANPLFESAAAAFENRLVAVVLTGSGFDATDGVQSVKAHGGLVIAQDPASAEFRSMPLTAVQTGAVDYVLPLDAIGPALTAIVHGRPVPDSLPTA